MIKNVSGWAGRSKIDLPIPKNKKLKTIEISLNRGKKIEIQIDKDGDLCLKSSGSLKLLFNEENEAIFKVCR